MNLTESHSRLLGRQECAALRGLAILSIVLHNYCHILSFSIKESEFTWDINETMRWGDYLKHIDSHLLINIFSWGGHYALGAFMFLTGYCLVCKYEDETHPISISTPSFVWQHYKKLVMLATVPLFAYIAMQVIIAQYTRATILSLIAQMGMFINLFFKTLIIVPGPFWYLGMIMQVYIIYALTRPGKSRIARWLVPLVLIATHIVLHIAVPQDSLTAEWLRYNAPMAFIPFALGLLAARYEPQLSLSRIAWAGIAIAMAVAVAACAFNYYLWLLNTVLAAVALIAVVKTLRGWMLQCAETIGVFSALIYVLHPIARYLTTHLFNQWDHAFPHLQLLIYLTLTALAVALYRRLRLPGTHQLGNKTH